MKAAMGRGPKPTALAHSRTQMKKAGNEYNLNSFPA